MRTRKETPLRAPHRAAPGHRYFFIDRGEKGSFTVRPCMETGHPSDDSHWEAGNYFLSHASARKAIRQEEALEQWRKWRDRYLEELHMLKSLPPEEKERFLR